MPTPAVVACVVDSEILLQTTGQYIMINGINMLSRKEIIYFSSIGLLNIPGV